MNWNWGIIGTGNIAHKFAADFDLVQNAQLRAVASRSPEKARRFGKQFNIPLCFGNYEELANHPEIDVVYIATPHPFHYPNARLCLEANKAVLCEKPLTVNALEADALISLAQSKALFLMEALWSRFLPSFVELRNILSSGVLGDIHLVTADFGLAFPFDSQHRLFNPALGGGALLDLGVYLINFVEMVLGVPGEIKSVVHKAITGVDDSAAIVFSYSNGQKALLYCGSRVKTVGEAIITGSKGFVRLHSPFYRSTRITLQLEGQPPKTRDFPITGIGLHYQIQEVLRCLDSGKSESDIMPLEKSLAVMQVMDQLRQEWNVVYPGESK